MAKKLYTLDYGDGDYPQIVEFVPDPNWVVPQRGVSFGEAKAQLRRWAQYQVDHFRMVVRAANLARKEDVEGGSIYTDRVG